MDEQNSTQNSVPVRRVFRYGDHEFDDPGREYTVDQVRQILLPYFSELAHPTTDEKMLEDGTLQITFRKQVRRKGNDILELMHGLQVLSPYADPVTELLVRLGLQNDGSPQTCSLQTLLDYGDELEEAAEQVRDQAARIETMVQKCWQLPSSPVAQIALGF